jgi:hypothetical protein
VARLYRESGAKYATSTTDPGDPCTVARASERAVEHLQTDEWIVGDSHRIWTVTQCSSSDAHSLRDLVDLTEPENFKLIHRTVVSLS